ncbi:MAG TPA: isopentenyl-diphosphate Delta-isomerase [Pyrinomonadaceae bacterium]|nr:isopentenyl-diphosphate Delta-isomerase [Pyrinomonadaceae bacterium]
MLRNYKISIPTGLVLAFLAAGAFFMTRVELPAWSHVLSSINVLLFAIPSMWALKMWLGWKDAGKLVLILGLYALAIETFAIFTGFPYGHFGYSEHLGYKLFGQVPWTVAFAWTPLMLCAYAAARSLFVSRLRRIAFAALLLVVFDLVLDPGAVLLGFWQYPGGGVFYGVPISNFLGWVFSGAIGAAIMEAAVGYFRPLLPPPVQLGSSAFFIMFFWTAIAAFGGLAVPAAIGGALAMAMYLWWRRSYYAFDEMVVLVDEENNPLGTARKSETHHHDTHLHRAFSVFLFNEKGELLMQRRAFGKLTWPGVWSNSCCGHTMLNERTEQAAARRLAFELGLKNVDLQMALPDFRYRAEKDGIVENEICPVLVGVTDQEPSINSAEVAETKWVPWNEFLAAIRRVDCELSPWAIEEGLLLAESPVLRALLKRTELRAAA